MTDPKGVVPIGAVRERVIQTLTEAFANDLISVSELEDRLEKVYRATTAAEAEALAAGLARHAPVARGPGTIAADERRDSVLGPEHERLSTILSSQSRRGQWAVPRKFMVFSLFAETVIDLTHATLPEALVDIEVRAIFSSVKFIVPPGLRVVNRVGAFAANVESEPSLDLAPMVTGSPVIRLAGSAVFADVQIVASSPGTDQR